MSAPLPIPLNTADPLVLYGETFASRLLLGTSRYPSPQVLENAVKQSNPGMITVSLRRQGTSTAEAHSGFWDLLKKMAVPVLPNTAGCHRPQGSWRTDTAPPFASPDTPAPDCCR